MPRDRPRVPDDVIFFEFLLFLYGLEPYVSTFFVNFRVWCWCGVVWCWCVVLLRELCVHACVSACFVLVRECLVGACVSVVLVRVLCVSACA